ncbi:MAG: cytochrome c biogenesis protein [Candidatus Heimdallarchaeota archaeon]|nr:cytochrome c biogenesis protein [Candidatus Heimdallarchaeota archaeon]MCK4877009.1 cytochrome c biogenesis protein [Candidatus Heimdallarchaeota archaeon]
MRKKQLAIIISSLVIIGAGVGVYFLVQNLGTQTTIAPNYTLSNINGTDFTIVSLQNKTVLFDFMSVSCVPCKQMYPILADLLEDLELKNKIEIISIETDNTTTIPQLQAFALEQEITWTLSIASPEMVIDYGIFEIPAFVVINTEGEVTFAQEGLLSFDTLKEECLAAIEGRREAIQITSYQGFLVGFAIIVAITSFFSPCSFPLLPGYIAHIMGVDLSTEEEKDEKEITQKKNYLLYPILGFFGGVGILVSYLILGIVISAVGSAILPYVVYVLPVIGGIFILFGFLMFTNFEISFTKFLNWIRQGQIKMTEQERRFEAGWKVLSTFLYGFGYGVASLGCNGPIFLAFSLQVGAQPTVIKMIFAYLAFGLTIILLMVGVTVLLIFSKDIIVQKLKASTEIIKKISGAIMIVVGLYLLFEFIFGR